ncbi:Hsp70 family protein [Gandjariella thermophila]|uniref:Molecular chaperone DnaK n=1 Tax=Gandjariella thermophila TaxID=1931992 RepID=A0A4D4JC15_9PSEU|nr:Hsp70 family protein [Gandjariella thermophila]GDY31986.1 hypothetical protein GTS_36190 [Gandjariella thermophila]
MAVINVGVDFGSTGVRAAYGTPGEPARFVALAGNEWPWPLCEPVPRGPLPVSFPSVKSKLGLAGSVQLGGHTVNPADLVAAALRRLRARIVAETAAPIGHTVISVPARFFASQRSALLDVAGAAGLGEVSLVTDSVAAVVGHTGGEATGTFLVYGMGYEGFELGLVRAVRGRYRVLGYEGAGAPGGSTFDEQVLGGWLATLRDRGSLPDEVRQGETGWLRLRGTAEKVKEQLAAEGPVLFPMFVSGTNGQPRLTVQFEQPPFELLTRVLVAGTLDRADALFERSGLDRESVEAVVLVGGSTRMPHLRKLVSGLGAAVVPTADEHLARGAVLHAHQLVRRSSPGDEDQLGMAGGGAAEPVLDTPPLAATLLTAPGGASSAAAAEEATGLAVAQRLIAEGRREEAAAELRRLIAAAQELLHEITAGGSEEPPATPDETAAGGRNAPDLLSLARRRLDKGQYPEAINLAHLAWQREPNRADVFDAMIDIHCVAAMANPTIAGFGRDEKWLRCALGHDPSNARIRSLLAERSYLHGSGLHRAGRKDEARQALQQALAWDPEHRAAEELLHRLGGRR